MSNVLIVGAGPVGLLMAISLRQYDINVTIIDKINSETNQVSKALTITSASLKIFHGLDVIKDFLRRGRKLTKAEIFFKKQRIACINKKYLSSLYNFYLGIPQPQIQKILEQQLNQNYVYVQYQNELIDLLPSKENVQATIRSLQDQKIISKCFDFVIGCDGAHSQVRKLLKIPFIGDDYNINFILADVNFQPDFSPPCLQYYVDEHGFLAIYPLETGYTRIVVQRKGALLDPTIKLVKEDFQFHLNAYLPNKIHIERLIWSSSARVGYRIAQLNTFDRVFLAGDSYHLFSPVGGQSMNTGFQDAFELAWRLGHYLNGLAKTDLLDDFCKYRSVAIKKVLAMTDLYTKLIVREMVKHDKLKYFQPVFKNRYLYREELANEFSGYNADYSESAKDKVGKHIPYVKFSKSYCNLNSTFDLPRLKKHVVFMMDAFSAKESELQELMIYEKAIIKIKIGIEENELIEKLQINKKKLCMISPSGYLVVHGSLKDVKKYMQQYYLP